MPSPKKKPVSYTEIITPKNLLMSIVGLSVYFLGIYIFGKIAPPDLAHYDLYELLFALISGGIAFSLIYYKLKK
ncbi:MAG: hypothetical protein LC115_13690 [Bacteroidia bacterium]|nr:hypothetical protein [Bacteroidia bacterium]